MTTMSGLNRLDKCSASELLKAFDEESGIDASHGVAVHAYLEDIANGLSPREAFARVPLAHQEACATIDLSMVPHSQVGAWRPEMAFALDWAGGTARWIDTKNREYGELGETEIAGTADLVGLDGDTVWVLDVKTGYRWLGEPRDSLQLLGYAVAAAKVLGKTKVKVGFIFVRKDEDPRLVVDELTEMDLDLALVRIRTIMERSVFMKSLDLVKPVAGDHCRYCPAYRGCPAHAAMLAPLLSNNMDTARGSLMGKPTLAPIDAPAGLPTIRFEDIPLAMERLEAGMGLLKRLKKELEDAVRTHGAIEHPDGRVLQEVEEAREKIDGELAKPVLERLFGEDLASKAIVTKVSVTKKAIYELVSERAKDTKERKGALNDAVLEELKQVGAVSESRYYAVKFKPKPKLKLVSGTK